VGYELMGMAKQKGAIVVLNGQGADEAFAGYSSYYDDYWLTLMAGGRFRDAWREMRGFARALGGNAGRHAARVLRRLALRSMRGIGAYEAVARVARRRAVQQDPWFSADLASQ